MSTLKCPHILYYVPLCFFLALTTRAHLSIRYLQLLRAASKDAHEDIGTHELFIHHVSECSCRYLNAQAYSNSLCSLGVNSITIHSMLRDTGPQGHFKFVQGLLCPLTARCKKIALILLVDTSCVLDNRLVILQGDFDTMLLASLNLMKIGHVDDWDTSIVQ